MGASQPTDYAAVGHSGERMVEAHRFFSEQAREWLTAGGSGATASSSAAIETVVRELLQIVVIDLTVDENAQEIFETLNARGAQLTAADLINPRGWSRTARRASAVLVGLAGTRRGRQQVAEFFTSVNEVFEIQRFEPNAFIAQGDRVIVLGDETSRIKATGKVIDSEWAHAFTLRDGLVIAFHEYIDTAAVVAELQAAAART